MTHFTIESWNHAAFRAQGKPHYTMVWGPFPIETVSKDKDGKTVVTNNFNNEKITGNLRKFDPKVVIVKYRHAEHESKEHLAALDRAA